MLVGSPIYQKPEVLKAFFKSLKRLNRDTISIDYMFVDDNIDINSTQLIVEFKREESEVIISRGKELGEYLCNDESHHWDDSLMLKVANYKNTFSFPKVATEFRIKHLGWATQEDRTEKFKRYQLLDPDALYGIKEQYDSIMDTEPRLVKWDVNKVYEN